MLRDVDRGTTGSSCAPGLCRLSGVESYRTTGFRLARGSAGRSRPPAANGGTMFTSGLDVVGGDNGDVPGSSGLAVAGAPATADPASGPGGIGLGPDIVKTPVSDGVQSSVAAGWSARQLARTGSRRFPDRPPLALASAVPACPAGHRPGHRVAGDRDRLPAAVRPAPVGGADHDGGRVAAAGLGRPDRDQPRLRRPADRSRRHRVPEDLPSLPAPDRADRLHLLCQPRRPGSWLRAGRPAAGTGPEPGGPLRRPKVAARSAGPGPGDEVGVAGRRCRGDPEVQHGAEPRPVRRPASGRRVRAVGGDR